MYVAHYSAVTAFISCVLLNAVHRDYFAGPECVRHAARPTIGPYYFEPRLNSNCIGQTNAALVSLYQGLFDPII